MAAGEPVRGGQDGAVPVVSKRSGYVVVAPRRTLTSVANPCSATRPTDVRPVSNCGATAVPMVNGVTWCLVADQQHVVQLVDQRGDPHLVDRREADGVDDSGCRAGDSAAGPAVTSSHVSGGTTRHGGARLEHVDGGSAEAAADVIGPTRPGGTA